MAEAAVIDVVKKYLNCLTKQGYDISFGVLFGSQAKGDASYLSDIDLIVVSTDFDKNIQSQTLDELWKLAGRTDSRIEPIPCGLKNWEKDDIPPIYEIARHEGQIVYLN